MVSLHVYLHPEEASCVGGGWGGDVDGGCPVPEVVVIAADVGWKVPLEHIYFTDKPPVGGLGFQFQLNEVKFVSFVHSEGQHCDVRSPPDLVVFGDKSVPVRTHLAARNEVYHS
eukprot:TRINITY_DN5274_c0_g3_i1.p2 TRINITY_DN5274_c0_g3~~TRINITY_DN5274_c0_g3_i1.p2  ORF type:complete len:114 (-),score=21.06 TRINITY_DN5274_c0_g3_i1:53-394(-)